MEKTNKLLKVLFIIYCIILVWIILFKLSFDISSLLKPRSINLIPFYYDKKVNFQLSEIIKNIIIFIPLGIYLKLLKTSTKKTILSGLLVSTSLEILQFIFSIGSTDITDIITNTLGTIIGAFFYLIILKIFKNENKINKVLTILALIGTILLVCLVILLIVANL